jgi:hypothetical protein
MRRLDVAIPSSWVPIAPPQTDYRVGDARVTLSAVNSAPEDPAGWLRVELAQRAGGQPISDARLGQRALASGWPAISIEAELGEAAIVIVMFLFLEYAATAVIAGPQAAVAAARAEIFAVLDHATIDWGAPPPTLALLLDGASRS